MAFSVRTDLALEASELLDKNAPRGVLDGIISSFTQNEFCRKDRTEIRTKDAAKALGKAEGTYITLSFSNSDLRLRDIFEGAANELASELSSLLKLQNGEGVLAACLGNELLTPDSLGPLTARHIIPTRHLLDAPGGYFNSFRPVSVFTPGVLGMTGFESGELLAAAAERSGASALVAVDALASRSLERLCSTVQLSDTGIVPGSGVGNRRCEINSRTMGMRVVSIGVPTVADAATVAADVMQSAGMDVSNSEALDAIGGALFVTLRDIDEKIKTFARLVGTAVDLALNPQLTVDDICDLTRW